MIRTDGQYVIYRIQHDYAKDNDWSYSSFDYFGHPHEGHPKNGFSASGDCWQQTGVFGTFDADFAKKCLKYIKKKHPKDTFRLVKVIISQYTDVVN